MPYIGVGNKQFPGSIHNIKMQGNQESLNAITIPPFFPKPLPQIIIFLIWVILFLAIQVGPPPARAGLGTISIPRARAACRPR